MLLKWWIKDLEGMSDLCIYKFKDNIWDDISENSDHIVPHPSDKRWCLFEDQSDSLKKPRCEVVGYTNDAYSDTKLCFSGNEKVRVQTSIMKDTLLEKDSWSHTPDGVLPSSLNTDSFKDVKSVESSSMSMSHHCFKTGMGTDLEYCTDNPLMTDNSAADENDMYQYSVSHISQTDNNISFMDDDQENKEGNDLLYYGWQDIGNFEDVDRMFRNCDSTFGVGSLTNEDELCWFSTSHGPDKLEDPSMSSLKLSCCEGSTMNDASEFNEDSNTVNSGPSSISLNKNNISKGIKEYDGVADNGDSVAISHLSASNPSNRRSGSGNDLNPEKKESSYESSMPSSHCPSFDVPAIAADENRGKLYHQNLQAPFSKNFTFMSTPSSVTFNTSFPVRKRVPRSESEIEGHSETGVVSRGSQAELDSSNAEDKSCRSTMLDEISLEATSFRQLQQVMEQLDIRTKLCIRDSLYRLARSAEQRHNCGNLNDNIGEDKLVRIASMDPDTNRNGGFLDLETNTNPIDRSVAHLLFHRPSDPSVLPVNNTSPLKSQTMVATESQIFEEETGGSACGDEKPLANGEKL